MSFILQTIVEDALRSRPSGEGCYSAFGMTIAGPRRYLDGHFPAAAPGSAPELQIEVVHDLADAVPVRWRCLRAHDPESAASSGHQFLRLLEDLSGSSRRFELLHGLVVEAMPTQQRLLVGAPATMHPDTLGAFITGSALLCYFKALRRLCLHAAVIERDGAAILICGPSGAGKSSLAASLHRQGWSIVVEDLAVVEPVEDHFQVRPGYGRLRLWPDSVAALSLRDQSAPIASGAEKRYLQLPPYVGWSPPLAAIVFLGKRLVAATTPLDLQLERSPAVAMAQLYGNCLATYMTLPVEVPSLLAQCRRMVCALPCYSLRLANDWSTIDTASESLTATLRSAGRSS